MIVLTISTQNEMRRLEYDPPSYDILRGAVGGWYEHVHPMGLKRPYSMMVNEEELLHGLPLNPLGSALYGTQLHGQPIVGNIVIVKDGYYDGEPDVVGMTEDEAQKLGDKFINLSHGTVRWADN